MSVENIAIDVRQLVFRYGQRLALDQLDLKVSAGQIFALLGPNGSGKSTLFRILATLERSWQGDVLLFGNNLRLDPMSVRQRLGIVFQSPSLDKKLTVRENLRCQGVLYGLQGRDLATRMEDVAQQLGIHDRMNERAETLSGGLKRRVELAKGMLHRPRLLLMDEPSTGLDPASRLDLWMALSQLQHNHHVTVVLTTHLLEEADKAQEIAILDQGKCVASGTPDELRSELGAQVLSIHTQASQSVAQWLTNQQVTPQVTHHSIRVVGSDVANLVAPLCSEFGDQIGTVSVGRPGLEDVFIARTGHQFFQSASGEQP